MSSRRERAPVSLGPPSPLKIDSSFSAWEPQFACAKTFSAASYEAPFTKLSVVVGEETVTSAGITRLACKFLSLSINGGVTS